MTPALDTVLPIAAIGSGLLFLALAGLIGLMYLLTSSWFHGESAVAGEAEEIAGEAAAPHEAASEPAEAGGDVEAGGETEADGDVEAASETEPTGDAAEAERRRRAVVLAVTVAVARARLGRSARRAPAGNSDTASEWRRTGRARRLSKLRRRARTSA